MSTLDGLNLGSKHTRETTTKAGFVDRLLRVVAGQLNVRAPLLTACLNALVNALEHADVLLAKKITYGLGGVVPLMQYISGRKYEQLAEQCGEADSNPNPNPNPSPTPNPNPNPDPDPNPSPGLTLTLTLTNNNPNPAGNPNPNPN